GTTPTPQILTLTNTGAATTVQITVIPTSGSPWFNATPASANVIPGTPTSITVTVNTGLTAGIYTGNIFISPLTGSPLTVPVSLNVGGSGTTGPFIVAPNPLPTFNFSAG